MYVAGMGSNNLAVLDLQRGELDSAEAIAKEAYEKTAALRGSDHPNTIVAHENLGNVYFRQGRREDAEAVLVEVLASRRRALGDDHPRVGRTLHNLGSVRAALGRTDEAIENLRESKATSTAALGPSHPDVVGVTNELGRILVGASRIEEAADLYDSALAALREDGAPDSVGAALLMHQLAVCRFRLGDEEATVPLLHEAVEIRRQRLGATRPETQVSLQFLIGMLTKLERYEEAEPLALDLHEVCLEAFGPRGTDTRRAKRLLVDLYRAMGRDEEAAKWR